MRAAGLASSTRANAMVICALPISSACSLGCRSSNARLYVSTGLSRLAERPPNPFRPSRVKAIDHLSPYRSMAPRKQNVVPGTLDLLILKTLTAGPQHGYGIASHIKEWSREVLQIDEASMYPAL